MKKVKVKHPDIFQLAHAIVEAATDESEQTIESITKNIKAMSDGGKKGGRTRADKLTPEQRLEIATKAAKARWKK
jgi:hypothetical protein